MKEFDLKTKIHIEQGDLCGDILASTEGFDYYSYKGIPYAKPPVSDLRFQAPVEPVPWTGILNATNHGNRSVSMSLTTEDSMGNEDCLYLNVYTRKLPCPDTQLKAVMFWIHGGGFWSGSGDTDFYSPDYLLTEDVVLVTFNYRLAFDGFITVNDPKKTNVCQNIAFRDMIMALKWVKKNITAFNGDPNNVTAFGESFGATGVHLLICSPLAQGLFHKAICQSGTAFINYDEKAYMRSMAKQAAELLGGKFDNEVEAMEYIKSISAEGLIKMAAPDLRQYILDKYERLFGPVIESSTDSQKAVLPEDPEVLFERGDFNKVPLLLGTNCHDGMIYTTKIYSHRFIQPNILDSQVLIPRCLKLKKDTDESIELGNRILKFYYGLETPSFRNLEKFNKYHTDTNYNYQTKKAVRYHLKHKAPVYLYKFSLDSRYNLYKKILNINCPGACHGDELTYLFKTKYHDKLRFGITEMNTMTRLVKYWTNFAKFGNPNPIDPDPLFKLEWKPVQEGVYNHHSIGKIVRHVNEQPDHKTMQFWDQLFKEYGLEI